MRLQPSGSDFLVSRLHTLKKAQAQHRQTPGVKQVPGLQYLGRRTYDGVYYSPSDYFVIDSPAGPSLQMECGLLQSEAQGGCMVYRDINRNAYIRYQFCEDLLPHWRELDELYVELARKALSLPPS
jgi:hypothetical protein